MLSLLVSMFRAFFSFYSCAWCVCVFFFLVFHVVKVRGWSNVSWDVCVTLASLRSSLHFVALCGVHTCVCSFFLWCFGRGCWRCFSFGETRGNALERWAGVCESAGVARKGVEAHDRDSHTLEDTAI